MKFDMGRAIELLRDQLLRDLGDEVDLIFQYGSFLKGNQHQYSDLDLSYVPAHESTGHHITILVADTMIDLYPIRWSSLEQMANFDNLSSTVLLNNRIVYARTEEVAERFRQLPERLRELQKPEAYPDMLRKAQRIFQRTGYQYYLLQEQASKNNKLACAFHAQNILTTVAHSLAVCNQAVVDTRKLAQVLALPKLPSDFEKLVRQLTTTVDPQTLVSVTDQLLYNTRQLLLNEQKMIVDEGASFSNVFDSAYPELKGDIQHIMLACERKDLFNFRLMPLLHELMIHMAQSLSGVGFSDFNALADYQQDLVALGFPDLFSYLEQMDLDGLHQACVEFDEHLKKFLTRRDVALNDFPSLDALEDYLSEKARK